VAHGPPQQHRPQLVEHRANHLEPLAIRHLLVLVPKRTKADGVPEVRSEDLPCLRLQQEQRDLAQAAARTEQQGEDCSTQDVVGGEVQEKGALTDSSRPQNMNVMPGVGWGNPGRRLSTVLEQTNDVSVATRPAGWRKMCWGRPKAGDVDGEVEDVRQLVGDQ